MSTLELSWDAYEAPQTWYRLPSVRVAFVLSLLVHAAAIALLPSLRVPAPQIPPPLTVELAPQPLPEPKPEVLPAPPPVVKTVPKREPPPPTPQIRPRPEPEPLPVPETRAPTPPPQPIVVPQRPAPQPEPEVTAPPRVETPPPPRIETPPPAAPPRAEAPPPAPALDFSALHDYSAVVSNAVARKKVYPRMALMRRWQGTTGLKLQIAADGNLKALSVTHSSGFEILDEQAVKMVKDALPLPSMPEALRGREFVIDIPVAFKLQE